MYIKTHLVRTSDEDDTIFTVGAAPRLSASCGAWRTDMVIAGVILWKGLIKPEFWTLLLRVKDEYLNFGQSFH
jgi:hypothetical protein